MYNEKKPKKPNRPMPLPAKPGGVNTKPVPPIGKPNRPMPLPAKPGGVNTKPVPPIGKPRPPKEDTYTIQPFPLPKQAAAERIRKTKRP